MFSTVLRITAAEVERVFLEAGGTTVPPTAPRIRVERCIGDNRPGHWYYLPGWLVLYGDGPGDWCQHDHWDEAMTCALDRARARALGILGRW